mmetsp:Transcript_8475/g.17550  ORF Transcript_8475/g.17550 Transcript_8475/m.17550 type:complete len:291 (-) Transcript_8475:186-1058(-)
MRLEDHAVGQRNVGGGLVEHVVQLRVLLELGVDVIIREEPDGLVAAVPLLLLKLHVLLRQLRALLPEEAREHDVGAVHVLEGHDDFEPLQQQLPRPPHVIQPHIVRKIPLLPQEVAHVEVALLRGVVEGLLQGVEKGVREALVVAVARLVLVLRVEHALHVRQVRHQPLLRVAHDGHVQKIVAQLLQVEVPLDGEELALLQRVPLRARALHKVGGLVLVLGAAPVGAVVHALPPHAPLGVEAVGLGHDAGEPRLLVQVAHGGAAGLGEVEEVGGVLGLVAAGPRLLPPQL